MDGVAVFKTSDKSCYETYRFAKLKSWAMSMCPIEWVRAPPRARAARRAWPCKPHTQSP